MKVLICWSHISGYMAACWRALAASGVDLSLLAFRTEVAGSGTQAAFKDDVVGGLDECVDHGEISGVGVVGRRGLPTHAPVIPLRTDLNP